MRSRIYCGVLATLLIALPNKSAVSQDVGINSRIDSVDSYTSTWTNEFTLVALDPGDIIAIQLDLPDSHDLRVSSSPAAQAENADRENAIWKFVADSDCLKVAITISGSKQKFKTTSLGSRIEKNGQVIGKLPIVGPEPRYDPAFVRPIIGGGTGILLDDQIDWKATNDHLLVENDSRVRPAILAGVLFNVKSFTRKLKITWPNVSSRDSGLVRLSKQVPKLVTIPANIALLPLRATDDILASFEFSEGTSRVLDGFVFGLSKRISRNLSFVFGYSLRKGHELSPGFRRFAANAIASDKNRYEAFTGFTEKTKGNRENLLDGFPLLVPSANEPDSMVPIFPGEPIISSFNHAIHIGLVVPLDLLALFEQGQ